MKALGTGHSAGVLWRDVEVVRLGGPPQLRFHGGAARHASPPCTRRSPCSPSHIPTRWRWRRCASRCQPVSSFPRLEPALVRPSRAATTASLRLRPHPHDPPPPPSRSGPPCSRFARHTTSTSHRRLAATGATERCWQVALDRTHREPLTLHVEGAAP